MLHEPLGSVAEDLPTPEGGITPEKGYYYPGRSRAGRRVERSFGSKKRIHESLPSRRRRIAAETKKQSSNNAGATPLPPPVPPPDDGVREPPASGPGDNGCGVSFEGAPDPA